MKTEKKTPFRSVTLNALAKRRQQLQREADLALLLLEYKAGEALQRSKQWVAAKTSVPKALSALTAAGAQYLAGNADDVLSEHPGWQTGPQLTEHLAKKKGHITGCAPFFVLYFVCFRPVC